MGRSDDLLRRALDTKGHAVVFQRWLREYYRILCKHVILQRVSKYVRIPELSLFLHLQGPEVAANST